MTESIEKLLNNEHSILDNDLSSQFASIPKTDVLEVQKAMSSVQQERDDSGQTPKKSNPEDEMLLLRFAPTVEPEIAAGFLTLVNAAVFTPLKSDNTAMKHFLVRKKDFTKFVENYKPGKNKDQHPTLTTIYKTVISKKSNLKTDPVDKEKAYTFIHHVQPEAYAHNAIIFESDKLPTYEKVNFMHFLALDDFDTSTLTPKESHANAVYTQFVRQYISAIQTAKTKQQQENVFSRFMFNFVMADTMFLAKANQFRYNIGQLKHSTPPSLQVVLDDCSRANLFDLDSEKTYHIMSSVCVSKIKQVTNFSNLVIHGNFICENAGAQIVLPQQINGALVLSGYPFISTIIHIPNGTKVVDLSHSIKSFAELNKLKFPSETDEVRVARSLINNVTKNPDELKQIQTFLDNYPNIEIWDTKGTKSLRDELEKQQQILAQKKQPVQPVPVIAPKKKPETPEKTAEWLTRKEIADMYRADERFANVDIDRLVQRATPANCELTESRLNAGCSVICVHQDNLKSVETRVLEIMADDEKRAKKSKEKVVVKQETPAQQQVKTRVKTVRIKKYIPKQVWKEICNACGDSSQLLYSVLERINRINVCYDTQSQKAAPVQYIDKDGIWQSVPNTEFKRGKAATQFIENNDNRRIVWTINSDDKVMVAIAFFLNHADNACDIKGYNSIALPNAGKGYLMDGKTFVDKALVNSADYLDVSDLLKQYKPKTRKEPEVPEIPEVPAASEPKAKPQKQKKVTLIAKKEKPVAEEKPVKEKTDVALPKIDLSQIKKEPVRKKRHYDLVDVDAAKCEIDLFVQKLDEAIKKLSVTMEEQKENPIAQLRTLDQIKKLVKDKMKVMCK